jgi:RNA polymerase sigma factor (sigma-70 family)
VEGIVLDITSDAHILAACEQDPERFRELFERHYRSTLAFLARRVGVDLAEDLAVETFAVAFTRRGTYDLTQPDARPWLLGIATNLLRHHHRAERRKLLAYARSGLDPEVSSDPAYEAVEARMEARAAGPALALALANLRPAERDVLLLHAWGDLSYADIAEALAVPIGTVRSRLSRARGRFRELLAANGQVFGDMDGTEER